MDFMKYLDVMIGLAVVMVLLSPLVTAFTHILMWAGNKRSLYLLQGLQRLIVQLEANPAAIIRVSKGNQPVAGAAIEPLGTADTAGELWLPNGVADQRQADGTVSVKVTANGAAVADACLTTTLIPQKIREPQQVVSTRTEASGETRIKYEYSGPPGYSSSVARLFVRNSNATGAKIDAQVRCTVGGVTSEVPVTAAGGGTFVHPAGPNAPASYEVQCTVIAASAPVQDVVVEADFERNARYDRQVTSGPTNSSGEASLKLGVMTETLALTVAKAVVNHPMVARTVMPGPWAKFPPFRNKEAEVIEREELIRILLELASGEGPGAAYLVDESREALLSLLAANGIPNPSEALIKVRSIAQDLEHAQPSLASHVRHTRAIVEGAKSDFVGKLTQWFDAAMARSTQQYAANARVYTMFGAGLVAVVLQLNSVDLLQRLSSDSRLRDSLVAEAKNESDRIDKLAAATRPNDANAASDPANPSPNGSDTTDAANGAAGSSSQDDLQFARAKHKEIEQNLALLRKPELAIVPDHFVWQRVPRARLARNPLWTGPYPETLELIVGGASYSVRPRWHEDPLKDIQAAVVASGAPVDAGINERDEFVVLQSDEPIEVKVVPIGKKPAEQKTGGAVPSDTAAQDVPYHPAALKGSEIVYAAAALDAAAQRFAFPQNLERSPLHLVVNGEPVNLVNENTPAALRTLTEETFASTLAALVAAAHTKVAVSCRDKNNEPRPACSDAEAVYLLVVARDASVRDIRILSNPVDPYSNILTSVARKPRAWKVPLAAFDAANAQSYAVRTFRTALAEPSQDGGRFVTLRGCSDAHTRVSVNATKVHVDLPACAPEAARSTKPASTPAPPKQDAAAVAEASPAQPGEAAERPAPMPTALRVTAASHRDGELVITSHRRAPLELRFTAGKPESNMFDPDLQYVWDWDPDQREMLGIVLTWALLSLGAPFWFDALKNLLKLRPAPAATEQQNREERLKDSAKKT